jgi:hypothetical protein
MLGWSQGAGSAACLLPAEPLRGHWRRAQAHGAWVIESLTGRLRTGATVKQIVERSAAAALHPVTLKAGVVSLPSDFGVIGCVVNDRGHGILIITELIRWVMEVPDAHSRRMKNAAGFPMSACGGIHYVMSEDAPSP